jgi:mRNA-degrading endonuclease toxin of MazEF toxin-antitoxin module
VRRGAIYWINLGVTSPPEFGKTRPGLLVSNSIQNGILDSVVVVPLSTNPGEIWPLRIKLDGPMNKTSFAVMPGIRQVSKTRLLKFIAFASPEFMEGLDEALSLYLSD